MYHSMHHPNWEIQSSLIISRQKWEEKGRGGEDRELGAIAAKILAFHIL